MCKDFISIAILADGSLAEVLGRVELLRLGPEQLSNFLMNKESSFASFSIENKTKSKRERKI